MASGRGSQGAGLWRASSGAGCNAVSGKRGQVSNFRGANGASGRVAVLAVLAGLAAGLAACSGSQPDANVETRAGLSCVDDSRHCIDQRQTALRSMVGDKDRKWVREPASPQAYASGVRLFAFKSRKKDLSCDELAVGRREADAGPGVLRGSGGSGLSPAQVSRGVMLSSEVSKELSNEMQRRCKA